MKQVLVKSVLLVGSFVCATSSCAIGQEGLAGADNQVHEDVDQDNLFAELHAAVARVSVAGVRRVLDLGYQVQPDDVGMVQARVNRRMSALFPFLQKCSMEGHDGSVDFMTDVINQTNSAFLEMQMLLSSH